MEPPLRNNLIQVIPTWRRIKHLIDSNLVNEEAVGCGETPKTEINYTMRSNYQMYS